MCRHKKANCCQSKWHQACKFTRKFFCSELHLTAFVSNIVFLQTEIFASVFIINNTKVKSFKTTPQIEKQTAF